MAFAAVVDKNYRTPATRIWSLCGQLVDSMLALPVDALRIRCLLPVTIACRIYTAWLVMWATNTYNSVVFSHPCANDAMFSASERLQTPTFFCCFVINETCWVFIRICNPMCTAQSWLQFVVMSQFCVHAVGLQSSQGFLKWVALVSRNLLQLCLPFVYKKHPLNCILLALVLCARIQYTPRLGNSVL